MKSENELIKLNKYICMEFRHYRVLKGLTLEEVSFALGCSSSYLSSIEKGKREKTSFITYLRLANYYGINIKSIISNAEERIKMDESI